MESDCGFKDVDGSELNGIYDFYDLNGDGIQQNNEPGEIFFDYGIDGIKNSEEIDIILLEQKEIIYGILMNLLMIVVLTMIVMTIIFQIIGI